MRQISSTLFCCLFMVYFLTAQSVYDVLPSGQWLPRMTTAERQALSATNAQMVFDTDIMMPCFYVTAASEWRCLLSVVPDVDQSNFGGNLPFTAGGFNGQAQGNVVDNGDGTIIVQSNSPGNRYGYNAQIANAGKAFEVIVRVDNFTGVNAILNLNSTGTTNFGSFVELAIENSNLKIYASGQTAYTFPDNINYTGTSSVLKIVGTSVAGGTRDLHFFLNGQHVRKLTASGILGNNVDVLLYGWNGNVTFSDFHHSENPSVPLDRSASVILKENNDNFADPFVMNDTGGNYYCFATNQGMSPHIPVLRTSDFINYTNLGDALPGFPSWSSGNPYFFWAPGVKKFGNQYVLYYVNQSNVVRTKPNGSPYNIMAIGTATSPTPEGPYTHVGSSPLILRSDLWGAIDPEPFTDPVTNKTYLLWKSDANAIGAPTELFAVELSADGLSIVGQHHKLLTFQQGATEDVLIENPSIYFNAAEAKYYMLYSTHYWDNDNYNTGVATADSFLGPYTRLYNGALLSKGHSTNLKGPGGGSFFLTNRADLGIIFHGRTGVGNNRAFHVGDVEFDASGLPVVLPGSGSGFQIN